MNIKVDEVEFEWDEGNLDKSSRKHGVTPGEAESIFIDKDAFVFPDVRHSEKEERFVILGRSELGRNLFVIFTMRRDKIRIISARRMHRKEVEKYDKAKKSAEV